MQHIPTHTQSKSGLADRENKKKLKNKKIKKFKIIIIIIKNNNNNNNNNKKKKKKKLPACKEQRMSFVDKTLQHTHMAYRKQLLAPKNK
jgi:hypothetical protein